MSAQLLNQKHMFCPLRWDKVVTLTQLAALKKTLTEYSEDLNPKEKQRWEEIVGLLDALPEKEVPYSKNKLCKMVVAVGSPSTTSRVNEDIPESMEHWGWDETVRLATHMRAINAWYTKHEAKLIPLDNIQSVLKWKKRFDNGEYIFKNINPLDRFAQSEGCAIFISNSHSGGGFLDARGHSSAPLSGARLFESSGAAYTTIRSRDLQDAVVVHVNSSLLHIDANNTTHLGNAGNLTNAVAHMERKRLEDALKDASVEQLKARLAELEPDAQNPVVRRKM